MTRKNDTSQPDIDTNATKPEAKPNKAATVITMLEQKGGATLEQLVAATDWQPHTARAVLSGLKKKGHVVTRDKVDGVSRYRIVEAIGQ